MKFSIVVPVYNVAPYLSECLDSVMAQCFGDWECICVDDGSTDGSGAILDDYAAKDKRLRVVHQTNSGVSAARNAGLAVASGEWMTFLDADDIIAHRYLETANDILMKEYPDMLRMREVRFCKETPCEEVGGEYRILCGSDEVQDWGWKLLEYGRSACYQFQRTEVARRYLFPEGVTYCEDSARNLLVLPSLKKVCVSDYAGYFYRLRLDSSCSQTFMVDERLRFFRACEETLPSKGHKRQFAHYAWENLLVWILWCDKGEWSRRDEILAAFNGLMSLADIGASDMKPHWVVPYWFYSKLGMVWPICATRWMLRVLKGSSRR